MQNVIITEGKLAVGMLEYQLTDYSNEPVDFNYRGEASVEGDALARL